MYIHSIECKLAAAKPEYGEYSRRDSLDVLNDCCQNMLCNGKLRTDEIPEVVILASAFNEFYEGALGAYSTHTIFGRDSFAGIQKVAKIAEIIGWTSLSKLLKTTEGTLKSYPQSVVDKYCANLAAEEDVFEQLGALLVYNFGALVEQDLGNDYKMRRRAQDWVQSQLEPSKCDDTNAVPLLPGTIEAARNRLGLDIPIPSLVEWRQTLSVWQANRQ